MRYVTSLLLLLWVGCAASDGQLDDDIVEDDPEIARLVVCYDYGCATRKPVYLFESDWAPVRRELADSPSAAEERRRIARAVGIMEAIVGTMTPTADDLPGNGFEESLRRGQMDCIDESTNTSAYLQLFERQGLLRWHRVVDRVHRAPGLVNEHWAAQIEERGSRQRFAVDSWYRANGEPAVIQPLGDWRRRAPIPSLEPTLG